MDSQNRRKGLSKPFTEEAFDSYNSRTGVSSYDFDFYDNLSGRKPIQRNAMLSLPRIYGQYKQEVRLQVTPHSAFLHTVPVDSIYRSQCDPTFWVV